MLTPYKPPPEERMEMENLEPALVRAAFVQYFSPFADSLDHPLYEKVQARGSNSRKCELFSISKIDTKGFDAK